MIGIELDICIYHPSAGSDEAAVRDGDSSRAMAPGDAPSDVVVAVKPRATIGATYTRSITEVAERDRRIRDRLPTLMPSTAST